MKKLLSFVVLAVFLCAGAAHAESINFFDKAFNDIVDTYAPYHVDYTYGDTTLGIDLTTTKNGSYFTRWEKTNEGLRPKTGTKGTATISFSQAIDIKSFIFSNHSQSRGNTVTFSFADGTTQAYAPSNVYPAGDLLEIFETGTLSNVVAITLGMTPGFKDVPGYFFFKNMEFDFYSPPPAATPIPAAAWLLGSGMVGLIGLRRKLR